MVVVPVAVVLCPAAFVFSQTPAGAVVSQAAAERYLLWAGEAIGEGRWDEALGTLERGADFADVSSDISYLLALARYHQDLPLRSVLDSLGRAFDTDRWEQYSPAQGRFLEAEALIGLRMFSQALRALSLAEQSPGPGIEGYPVGDLSLPPIPRPTGSDVAALRLLAFKGLGETEDLLRALGEAMERYPRDPRPAGILFLWARDRMPEPAAALWPAGGDGRDRDNEAPGGEDRALIDRALRRLPLLLEDWGFEGPNPFGPRFRGTFTPLRLVCLAVPFIRDSDEARRLVSACRALGKPERESIPVSLDLGVIDEGRAMEELFDPTVDPGEEPGGPVLDRDLIRRVWSLLRDRESRDLFRRRLLRFSGLIVTDTDGDGNREERSRYAEGMVREYYRDADQDGREELRLSFSAGGIPREARLSSLGMPETAREEDREGAREPVWDRAEDGGGEIRLRWERYPAVLDAELDGVVYVPAPETWFYAPIRLSPLPGGDTGMGGEPGFLYPEAEPSRLRLTARTLVSFALTIIRPSLEFPGGFEHITMERGIPRRAVEVFEGRVVGITEFVRGQPRIQRVDLDLDGWMETIRRFREGTPAEDPLAYGRIPELVETDRDRDGLYEMGEQFLPDGTSIYSWDTDGDGVRDFFETRTGK